MTRAHRNPIKYVNKSSLFSQSQRKTSVHNTVQPTSVNNETRNRGLRVNLLTLSYPQNKEPIFTTAARRNEAHTHPYWSQVRNDCEFYPYSFQQRKVLLNQAVKLVGPERVWVTWSRTMWCPVRPVLVRTCFHLFNSSCITPSNHWSYLKTSFTIQQIVRSIDVQRGHWTFHCQ